LKKKNTNPDKPEPATTHMSSKKRARTSAGALAYIEAEAPEDNNGIQQDVTSSLENDDNNDHFFEEKVGASDTQRKEARNDTEAQEDSDSDIESDLEEEIRESDDDFIDDTDYGRQFFHDNAQDEVSDDEEENNSESEDELMNEIRAHVLEKKVEMERVNSPPKTTKTPKENFVRKRVRWTNPSDEDDEE
jgi:hypothetical protein